MADERLEKAARAVHEVYNGRGSWADSSSAERNLARQAVQLVSDASELDPERDKAAFSDW